MSCNATSTSITSAMLSLPYGNITFIAKSYWPLVVARRCRRTPPLFPQTGAERSARLKGGWRGRGQVLARGGRTPGLLQEVRPKLPEVLRSSDPSLHRAALALLAGLLSDPSECSDDTAGAAVPPT